MSVFKIALYIPVFLIGSQWNAMAQKSSVPPEMKLAALPLSVVHPKDNPSTPEKITLGRFLFFDPILSANTKVACSTCHHPRYGWADGRATPLGVGGKGIGPKRLPRELTGIKPLARNTMSLLNVGFNGFLNGQAYDPSVAHMFWDSRESGLEAQIFHPIRTRAEMLGNVYPVSDAVAKMVARVEEVSDYRKHFAKAFPDSKKEGVTANQIAKAIASFERTLISRDSPFDRFMRGDGSAMTIQQQRGMKTFERAGCIHCHGGPMFSDFKPHFIGLLGVGDDDRKAMRTPTLRNLRFTAPYMHNGSVRSLDDAMTFYEELMDAVSETLDGGDPSIDPPLDPLLKHLHLDVEDFAEVLAFLDALNDDSFDRSIPKALPSGLPVSGE